MSPEKLSTLSSKIPLFLGVLGILLMILAFLLNQIIPTLSNTGTKAESFSQTKPSVKTIKVDIEGAVASLVSTKYPTIPAYKTCLFPQGE